MCDTRNHEHWCSGCGKNLNKAPKDSYTEIEWSQSDSGKIVEEKGIICKKCLEESENIKELAEFFKNLEYPPWGRVFCSVCKKDLTKELGKDIIPGVDYECLSFKCHQRSGPNIRHIIKVVVLCKNCVGKEFNADNLEKLKKLGKNPKFTPLIVCDKIDQCRQYKKGDKNVNCKNIVIGRDRETLHFGILCGRRHKGCQLLPFDDGFSITRPRKGKGAAIASPTTIATAPGLNPIQDYIKEIEILLKKYKLGKFGEPTIDYSGKILSLEARLLNIEKALGIKDSAMTVVQEPVKIECAEVEHAGVGHIESVQVIDSVPADNSKKGKLKKK